MVGGIVRAVNLVANVIGNLVLAGFNVADGDCFEREDG